MLVLIEDNAGVRTVTLNRPEKRNAMSTRLLADLTAALRDADADPEVIVVLLTGAGPSFTAGADLAEMSGAVPASEASVDGKSSKHYFNELIPLLTDLSKPLVVAVNGPAAGFGMTILGYADLVFMSRNARLRCPFTEFGLAPEAASSYLLPALVGRQNAAWILLSSEWISAEDALAMGLAWKLCEPDDVVMEAAGYAAKMAARSPASLAAVKRTMMAPRREEILAAHEREMAEFARLLPDLKLS